MKKPSKKAIQNGENPRSSDEAERIFKKAVERMVNTPPKPHKPKADRSADR